MSNENNTTNNVPIDVPVHELMKALHELQDMARENGIKIQTVSLKNWPFMSGMICGVEVVWNCGE